MGQTRDPAAIRTTARRSPGQATLLTHAAVCNPDVTCLLPRLDRVAGQEGPYGIRRPECSRHRGIPGNQSPLGRVATPEEVADVIAYLARPGNDSITGCVVDVNGASYLRT